MRADVWTTRRRGRPPKAELIEWLGELSKSEICRQLRINDRTLQKWLNEYNLTEFIRSELPNPTKQELHDFLQEHTLKQVREHYEVSKTTVDRWLEELGLSEFSFNHRTMISLAEAARIIGVSRSMASQWFRSGLIPGAVKINTTRVSVPKTSIHSMKSLITD